MNELPAKILAYAVDWTGDQDPRSLEKIVTSGIEPRHLHRYDHSSNRFVPTVYSELFRVAILHYRETGALIDQQVLAFRFRTEEADRLSRLLDMDRQAVIQDAVVAGKAAKESLANGSELDYICDQTMQEYGRYDMYRKLSIAANKLPSADPRNVRDDLLNSLSSGDGYVGDKPGAFSVKDVVDKRKEKYEQRLTEGYDEDKMLTGFTRFDKTSGGFMAGEVALIVGGTGIGKSQVRQFMMLNFWRNGHSVMDVLSEYYSNVGQFRLECMELTTMPDIGVASNGLSLTQALERGQLTAAQKESYYKMLEMQAQREGEYVFVEPDSYDSLNDIEPVVATWKNKAGITALGIDALHDQIVRGANDLRDDLRQGEVMAYLKRLALRYGLCVITEVQEQQATVGRSRVRTGKVIKYSHKLPAKADFVLRLYKSDPNSYNVTAQVLKHRTQEDGYSFTIDIQPDRMYIDGGGARDRDAVERPPAQSKTSVPNVPEFGELKHVS